MITDCIFFFFLDYLNSIPFPIHPLPPPTLVLMLSPWTTIFSGLCVHPLPSVPSWQLLPDYFLNYSFSASALQTFGVDNSLLQGAVLSIVWCLTSSLSSTYQMPVAPSPVVKKKVYQGTLPHVPCREKSSWLRTTVQTMNFDIMSMPKLPPIFLSWHNQILPSSPPAPPDFKASHNLPSLSFLTSCIIQVDQSSCSTDFLK